MRTTFFLILFILSINLFSQTKSIGYADFCNAYPTKVFYDTDNKGSKLWEGLTHNCDANRSEAHIKKFPLNVTRKSQGHLESCLNGNVKYIGFSISPPISPLLNLKHLKQPQKRATISCIWGFTPSESFIRQKDRNYFEEVAEQLLFIKRFALKKQQINGTDFTYYMPKTVAEFNELLENKQAMGVFIGLKGGHSLSNSIFFEENLLGSVEYEALIMKNLDKLKGTMPLIDNTNTLLDFPVVCVSLGGHYANGLVGNSHSLPDETYDVIEPGHAFDLDISELGKRVVKKMLDQSKGRRILLDLEGMSLASRQWYYKYVEKQSILSDKILIVANNVGVSGLSWDSEKYLELDSDRKNQDSYLNNKKSALSTQDVKNIVQSNGIIGISLDPSVIGGELYKTDLQKAIKGTEQERQINTKLIVANLLKAVQSVGVKKAWNFLVIGSGFDTQHSTMASYASSENMPQLALDLLNYFKEPTPIFNLYTAEEVKKLMYGNTAKDITDKVMGLNMQSFLKRFYNQLSLELAPPSTKGNTTLTLNSHLEANSVTLVGDFNDWNAAKTVFYKENGVWTCKIDLPPGTYQYKFVVDSQWILDPENSESKNDDQGNIYSVLTVK
jgi:hypothetical protein